MQSKLNELEDNSQRNNLPVDGVPEVPKDTWELCEKNIKNVIQDKLGVEKEIALDRCD